MSFDTGTKDAHELGLSRQHVLAHERRIMRCRAYRAMIIWFRTASGKNIAEVRK